MSSYKDSEQELLDDGNLPIALKNYIEHIAGGKSLREIARGLGCHPSTILRQVRQYENRRDDPLVDEALDVLSDEYLRNTNASLKGNFDMNALLQDRFFSEDSDVQDDSLRVLRRLCESDSQLVLATDMDKAVVLRGSGEDQPTRTAVVERKTAQNLAIKEWVKCLRSGRVSIYVISNAGRAALRRHLQKETANRQARLVGNSGFSECQTGLENELEETNEHKTPKRVRYNTAESPLTMLARRKEKDGRPFLDSELVQAGERLREDFELSQLGPSVAQNWDRFLTYSDKSGMTSDTNLAEGPRAARERFTSALEELGPGLGDILMRCCCFLEGLENAEKKMGWSARSGKIVLRIALQRLRQHYIRKYGTVSSMIG